MTPIRSLRTLLQNALAVLPLEPIDESFQARAPLSFRLGAKDRGKPSLRHSSLADGWWEISGKIDDWGLPGREAIIVPSGERRKQRGIDLVSAESFIPRSAPILANPHMVNANRSPKVCRSSDGRRYMLHDSDQTFIYGNDDRRLFVPTGYPWQCICELKFWTRVTDSSPWVAAGAATGFLAGRNVCVTASHAWPDGNFSGWKIDVIPGSFNGTSILGSRAHTNVHSFLRVSPYKTGSDIMVLGLYDSVGVIAGYFGAKTYRDRWEDWKVWTLAGYPYDWAPFGTLQQQIAIYDDDSGPDVTFPNGDWWDTLQLESYADSASGLSGGPLFSWFDDGFPYVIGVHRGREAIDYGLGKDANSIASGGRLLPAMINLAREMWD